MFSVVEAKTPFGQHDALLISIFLICELGITFLASNLAANAFIDNKPNMVLMRVALFLQLRRHSFDVRVNDLKMSAVCN